MAKCARCSSPKSVCVCGYTRKAGKRKKKRKAGARKAPTGRYWVCESTTGRTCGVHHRRMTAAVEHARRLRRKEREQRAYRSGNRPRSRKAKLTGWHIAARGFK